MEEIRYVVLGTNQGNRSRDQHIFDSHRGLVGEACEAYYQGGRVEFKAWLDRRFKLRHVMHDPGWDVCGRDVKTKKKTDRAFLVTRSDKKPRPLNGYVGWEIVNDKHGTACGGIRFGEFSDEDVGMLIGIGLEGVWADSLIPAVQDSNSE